MHPAVYKRRSSPAVDTRDIVVQLQNLDDLSLAGHVIVVDKTLLGIGTTLRGRFGE